jgi:beta-lactam-binding protein with PASTA domain
MCLILARGLRVEIPSNPATDPGFGDDRLERIVVLTLTPAPGDELTPGSTVVLTGFTGLIPSSLRPVPDSHPTTVEVPDVVGMTYPAAAAQIDALGGIVPVVDVTPFPPLTAEASTDGLEGYTVVAQQPAPGERLRFLTDNPSTSTVYLVVAHS